MADPKKDNPKAKALAQGIARGVLKSTYNHFGDEGVKKLVKVMKGVGEILPGSGKAPQEEPDLSPEDAAELEKLVSDSESAALDAELEDLLPKNDEEKTDV